MIFSLGLVEAFLLCCLFLMLPVLFMVFIIGTEKADQYIEKKEEESKTHGLDDLGVEKDNPSRPQ